MTGWMVMALMAAALVGAFKLLSLPKRRRLAFALLWPGMDPRPFEGDRRPDPTALRLVWRGLLEMAVGVGVLELGARLDVAPMARAWIAMGGMIVLIHLGLFDLLAGAWRWAGLPVEQICPSPWRSKSLTEFWGTRWNMAFHVFVRDRIYRPLRRRWGRGAALAAVFLFSGLAHELVLSLPAGGGWGLPTLYFAIHGALVWLEKSGWLKGSWWLTAAAVVLPLPLLFHESFVTRVVLPIVSP